MKKMKTNKVILCRLETACGCMRYIETPSFMWVIRLPLAVYWNDCKSINDYCKDRAFEFVERRSNIIDGEDVYIYKEVI